MDVKQTTPHRNYGHVGMVVTRPSSVSLEPLTRVEGAEASSADIEDTRLSIVDALSVISLHAYIIDSFEQTCVPVESMQL